MSWFKAGLLLGSSLTGLYLSYQKNLHHQEASHQFDVNVDLLQQDLQNLQRQLATVMAKKQALSDQVQHIIPETSQDLTTKLTHFQAEIERHTNTIKLLSEKLNQTSH